MTRYLARRILSIPLLLLAIVSIAFVLSHLTRGDPLAALIGDKQMENAEAVAAAKAKWGLDKSLSQQYLVYVTNLATGDFGTSFRTKRPVAVDLIERLPATLELVVAAMLVGTAFGIALGVLAARFRNSSLDHGARLFALLGSSTPVFWSALILLFIFSVKLGWLPGPGRLDPRTLPPPGVTGFMTIDTLLAGDMKAFREASAHLLLPAAVLGWTVTGIVSRMVRSSMLETLTQDYITAARARGSGELRVLIKHALRNALIPTITILGFTFAYLITGAVLTETIFSWPGIGSYAVDATRDLDYPAIMGVTIIGGLAFLLSNLATDIAYSFADPRVRVQ